jgi:hypothetical protein
VYNIHSKIQTALLQKDSIINYVLNNVNKFIDNNKFIKLLNKHNKNLQEELKSLIKIILTKNWHQHIPKNIPKKYTTIDEYIQFVLEDRNINDVDLYNINKMIYPFPDICLD